MFAFGKAGLESNCYTLSAKNLTELKYILFLCKFHIQPVIQLKSLICNWNMMSYSGLRLSPPV